MVSIWSRIIPYDNLEPSKFEIDLNKVLRDDGPSEYRDAPTFFNMTYSTKDLKDIVNTVDSALNGNGIVIGLQSPLGGGKTHTLLTLYHAFSNPEKVVPQKSDNDPFGLPKPRNKATVVALDGRDIPAGGDGKIKTIWGALFNSLGLYENLRKFDENLQPPEMSIINETLKKKGPTLIMLDELPAYMEKALVVPVGQAGQNLSRLTLEFIHTLTDSIMSSTAALIVTIPEESYEERSAELEKVLREVNSLIMRVAEPRTPHSQEDLAGILKRRLFKKIDDVEAKKIGVYFAKYYLQSKSAFPAEVSEPSYAEQIVKTYPLHPTMIKLLTERIVAIPGFQRTRGMLRFMAVVIESLRKKELEYGITPGDVDLSDERVVNELLKKFPIFKGVIKTDITSIDSDAKAQRLMNNRPTSIRVATAVFLNSFSLSGKDLASIAPTTKDIASQTSKPEENPFEIEDTLIDLSNTSYYLIGDQETKRYFYTIILNINRMIDDEANRISDVDALAEIRKAVQTKIGSGPFKAVFSWDTIPDDKPEPTLLILDPTETGMEDSLPPRAVDIWNKNSTSYRTYKNALVFAYITPKSQEKLINIATRMLAIFRLNNKELLFRSEKKDNELSKIVEEMNRKKLQNESSKIKAEFGLQIIKTYSNVIFPTVNESNQMVLKPISLLITASAKESIQSTIQELLDFTKGVGKLTDSIPPDMMLNEVIKPKWFENGTRPTVRDLVNTYYSNAELMMPTSDQVIVQSVIQGGERMFCDQV